MTTTDEDKRVAEELQKRAIEAYTRWNWYFMGLPIVALFAIIQSGPVASAGVGVVVHVVAVAVLSVAAIAGVVAQWNEITALMAMGSHKRITNILKDRHETDENKGQALAQKGVQFRRMNRRAGRELWSRRINYAGMAIGFVLLVGEYIGMHLVELSAGGV
ncbi:hypothetical protein QWY84_11095 [Aquisalimonas lutea]|uniref:hypothetical protein n=1 Tax=Aquisalimonas lutea TaxID=1327750 RepID=UPI0025B3361C|nr:hypothetical protein [Aquisalimonas lutea]MDN3518157.1 hypothetical protein [Aquisalimonas lutea]